MAKKTSTKKTTTKKSAKKPTRAKSAKTGPAQAKAVHAVDQENARLRDERAAAKDGLAASERAMVRSKGKKKDPAHATTEKARGAAIAEIDKNIAESAKQDQEGSSAQEKANDAVPAKSKGGGKGAKREPAQWAKGKKSAKAKKAAESAKPKRASLLDTAAVVLTEAKEPMTAKAIVEKVIERGLWKPGTGKTPAATLYSAMIREIDKKGRDARFRKVDRGQFASAEK